jgi:hypothetical protein
MILSADDGQGPVAIGLPPARAASQDRICGLVPRLELAVDVGVTCDVFAGPLVPCSAPAPAIVNVVLAAPNRLARIRGDGRDEAAQLALPVAD